MTFQEIAEYTWKNNFFGILSGVFFAMIRTAFYCTEWMDSVVAGNSS
jgi:hypothetical protein